MDLKLLRMLVKLWEAYIKEKKIGSCKYSDLTVFSLHPVKTITSGEGGLILTNNKKIYSKLLDLRMNGIRRTNKPTWEQDIYFPD